jgi:hypothetical protein
MPEFAELASDVREAAGAIAVARGGEGDASVEWQKFDDALNRLEEQFETLRVALNDPDLLHWLGSSDVLDVSPAVARAVAAIYAVRAALYPAISPEREPCDYCKTKGREWTPDCEENKHGYAEHYCIGPDCPDCAPAKRQT